MPKTFDDKLREIGNEYYDKYICDEPECNQHNMNEIVGELIISIKKLLSDAVKNTAHIMSDDAIKKSPYPNYARQYNQGKFDLMMDLQRVIKEDKNGIK